jgi:hypothetical protein
VAQVELCRDAGGAAEIDVRVLQRLPEPAAEFFLFIHLP